MNKNIIVIALLVVLIGFGVYFFTKTNNGVVVLPDTTQNTDTNTDKTPVDPIVTSPTAPSVDTSTNTSPSSSTVTVTGQVKPNGAATYYYFEYGTTTAFGSRTVSFDIGSGYNVISTPAYITGLKANTTYLFRLSAKNRIGLVNGSTRSFTTNTDVQTPTGSAPTPHTIAATSVTRTSVSLNGQLNPNGWDTNYWFEYGTAADFGSVTSVQFAGNTTSFINESVSLNALASGTKYFFRLNAQNQFGTVNGTILNFTTLAPVVISAPTVVTKNATNITKTGASLNGTINTNGAETAYYFEFSKDSLLSNLIGTGTATNTLVAGTDMATIKTDLSELSANTKYYYHLVATNKIGTIKGAILSFTTKRN